jgi:hypothetical protein
MRHERHRPREDGAHLVAPFAIKATRVDLDPCPKQKVGDLDCGRCRRIMREDLAADFGEFGIGCKVREVLTILSMSASSLQRL